MQEYFKDPALVKLLWDQIGKWFVFSPIFGWAFMVILFDLLESLGVQFDKTKKIRCWLNLSAMAFMLATLFRAFS
jgi:hypothetical protein